MQAADHDAALAENSVGVVALGRQVGTERSIDHHINRGRSDGDAGAREIIDLEVGARRGIAPARLGKVDGAVGPAGNAGVGHEDIDKGEVETIEAGLQRIAVAVLPGETKLAAGAEDRHRAQLPDLAGMADARRMVEMEFCPLGRSLGGDYIEAGCDSAVDGDVERHAGGAVRHGLDRTVFAAQGHPGAACRKREGLVAQIGGLNIGIDLDLFAQYRVGGDDRPSDVELS